MNTSPSSVLFEKANEWLKSNPQWKVISCESLESKLKYGSSVDTNKSTYGVNAKFDTNYNRSLRYAHKYQLRIYNCISIQAINMIKSIEIFLFWGTLRCSNVEFRERQ